MNIDLPIEELNLTFLSYSSRVELFVALIYSNVCPIPYVRQVEMPASTFPRSSIYILMVFQYLLIPWI